MNTKISIQHKELLQARHMVLIGATGRNSGKTTLALQIIDSFKDKIPIVAFKLISIKNHNDVCPRGGQGCGSCKGLNDCFDIREEFQTGTKDTMLLKKAGAQKVFLIRAFKEHIKEALDAALTLVPKNALILCESNSARLVIKPALFIMIQSITSSVAKPTAMAVMEYADIILPQEEKTFARFVQTELPQILSREWSL